MSTEQLIRDFYNEMYGIHMQSGNAYDLGDHLQEEVRRASLQLENGTDPARTAARQALARL